MITAALNGHTLKIATDATDNSENAPVNLDALALEIQAHLATSTQLEAESIRLGRQSSLALWKAGKALITVRNALKGTKGAWKDFKTKHGLKAQAYQAIIIAEGATEKEAASMSPTEIKRHVGILKPAKDKTKPQEESTEANETTAKATANLVSKPEPEPEKEPESITLILSKVLVLLETAGGIERHSENQPKINGLCDDAIEVLQSFKRVLS